jgi:biotin-(acetyl-CoA carboxylase) ligase
MQLVESLVGDLESEYDRLRTDRAGVQARYHERLLGLGRLRLFSRADETFNATITGVSAEGKLEVEMEDGRRQAFAVKEVVFAA